MREPQEPSDFAGAPTGQTSRHRAVAVDQPAAATATSEAAAWVSPRGPELLGWWAKHHRFDALLVLAWGGWLLLQSQLPQQHAAMPTSDGLTAGDWRLIGALGLHRLAGGPLTWLLAATTTIWVAASHWIAASERVGQPIRSRGHAALLGVAALGLGGVALALALAAAGEPPRRWQGVPGEAPTWMAPLVVESGRFLASADPAPATRCRRDGDLLRCAHDGAVEVALDGPYATLVDGQLWRISATTPATDAGTATLELGPVATPQDAVAFAVRAGAATLVPALRARVAVEPSARSGPIAIVARAEEPAQWLAAPGWVAGAPAGRWRSPGAARVEAGPATPTAIAVVALTLLGLLALAATVAGRRRSAPIAAAESLRDSSDLMDLGLDGGPGGVKR